MIELTDEQIRQIAACFACQGPVDVDYARELLAAGRAPSAFVCEPCRDDPLRVVSKLSWLGTMAASTLVVERIEEAGLMGHFENVALESLMREDNQQN